MLNNRAIQIIKELIEIKEITAKELAHKFKITTRTIYYDLENINYFLKKNGLQGTLKNGKKIFFKFKEDEKEKVRHLVGNGTLLDSGERKDYLTVKLFFYGMITLSKEAEILEVTRKTIEKDIKDIKEDAKNYGIKLTSLPSKGITFKGSESGIRILSTLYLTKILVQKHNLKPPTSKLLEEILSFSDISTLENITKKISKDYNLNSSVFIYYTFIAIMITDKLISKHNLILENQYDQFFKSNPTEDELKNLKNYLEENTLKFGEQCYIQLFNIIIRGDRTSSISSFDPYFIEIYKQSQKFLTELWSCYFSKEKVIEIRKLPTDEVNLRFLALRFENSIYKYNFNCKEYWKFDDNLPKRLKVLYNNIERISEKYFGKLLDEDLERLTYTAAYLMNKINQNETKTKKVVIAHFNLGILLKKNISGLLSSMWFLDVVKIIPGYELDDFLKNNDSVDGVIIFENGYIRKIQTNIPVIYLNIFALEESSNILFDYGYVKK